MERAIKFELTIHAPAREVWSVLTDAEHIPSWWEGVHAVKLSNPKPGGVYVLNYKTGEPDKCEILQSDAGKLLRFFLREIPGDDTARRKLRLDRRRGDHFAIQDNRHRLPDATACESRKRRHKVLLNLEFNEPLRCAACLCWLELGTRGGERRPRDDRLERFARCGMAQPSCDCIRREVQICLGTGENLLPFVILHDAAQPAEIHKF